MLVAILSGWGVYTYAQAVADDSVAIVMPLKLTKNDSIVPVVSSPKYGSVIKSPVKVSGLVSGTWFFEGSFTVEIRDDNQNIIGRGPVTAKTEWMTTEKVPFEGIIPFSNPTTENGVIEFIKEDPSGLNKKTSYFLKVSFGDKLSECSIGGCSSNICSDDSNIAGTCEWSEEYACYQKAICERQKNGKCEWTQTKEFKICMENVKNNSTGVHGSGIW